MWWRPCVIIAKTTHQRQITTTFMQVQIIHFFCELVFTKWRTPREEWSLPYHLHPFEGNKKVNNMEFEDFGTYEASWAAIDDSCLWNDDDRDTWTPKDDDPTLNEVTPTYGWEGLAFSHWMEACLANLSHLNMSWLSHILPLITSEKSYHNQRRQIHIIEHAKSNKQCKIEKSNFFSGFMVRIPISSQN